MAMLWGRFGPYKPRTPAERSKARKQAQERAQQALQRAQWLEKHKACLNGCGAPVAFYDDQYLGLRYSGCCSAECELSYLGRDDASGPHKGP